MAQLAREAALALIRQAVVVVVFVVVVVVVVVRVA
jgi:hypothetical protein